MPGESTAPQPIRCPACGGLNPATAEWCGQCLKRFTAPEPPPPPPPEMAAATGGAVPVVAGTNEADPLTDPVADGDPAGPPRVLSQRGAFKATDAGVLWACTRCGAENGIDDRTCSVCGAALAETMLPPPPDRPQKDAGTVALASLALPGAGHAMLGLWGQAIARAVLSTWVVGVALLIAFAGGDLWVILLFGLAALALWIAAAHDAFQEASGNAGAVVIKGRMFMYVVLGLLGLLIVALAVSALTGGGGGSGQIDVS